METLQDIWGELGTRLGRFIAKRVGDPHAAEDIAQDVMLKVQTNLDALPPGDKLPAWVFAIARNAVIDHYRAQSVRGHADIAAAESVVDDGAADRQEAIRELVPCLSKMVAHLPEPYRQAMRLADFEGLTQQEVADRLRISLSGAKSRVQRARRQLRDMIVDCCDVVRDGRGGVADVHATERTSRYCGDKANGGQCGE